MCFCSHHYRPVSVRKRVKELYPKTLTPSVPLHWHHNGFSSFGSLLHLAFISADRARRRCGLKYCLLRLMFLWSCWRYDVFQCKLVHALRLATAISRPVQAHMNAPHVHTYGRTAIASYLCSHGDLRWMQRACNDERPSAATNTGLLCHLVPS